MRLLLLSLLLLPASCGYFEKQRPAPRVSPDEQGVEVGSKSEYILDPTRTDKLLQDSQITATVLEKNEDKTIFEVVGFAKTRLGTSKFNVKKEIPNLVLRSDFLEELRVKGAYESDDFSVRYLGVDGDCDVLEIYSIKDLSYIKVEANFCSESKNIPVLRAEFKIFGYKIKATYLLK